MHKAVKKRKQIIPKKTPIPEREPHERRTHFNEVTLGYTADQARQEAERCLQCDNPQCVTGCPVHVPIPRFIQSIQNGDFKKALDIIKEANLMPAACGRVCPQEQQCEKFCTLAKKFDPVAIGRLERFAADQEAGGEFPDIPVPVPRTGKRVAIVGSGPSGLTCAYDLARLGHAVVVYEALHEPGGVLVYGIPEFRLPKRIVAREIETLKRMGVRIVTNAVVGKLFTIEELLEEHDACFIGTGAGLPKFMGIEGENLNGVYSANEFLTRVNLMRSYRFPEYDTPVGKGSRVAVIGGGNVALDAARTALRLGAKEAVLIYRRSLVELPSRKEEVQHAQQEGIRFELCTSPVRIIGKGDRVTAVECVRMDLCEMDDSGRRAPKPVEGSEFQIPADSVIMSIGTGANPLISRQTESLSVRKGRYIVVEEQTGRTSIDGVYAGGDIVTGAATVISAMGTGRKAARAMHAYIMEKK